MLQGLIVFFFPSKGVIVITYQQILPLFPTPSLCVCAHAKAMLQNVITLAKVKDFGGWGLFIHGAPTADGEAVSVLQRKCTLEGQDGGDHCHIFIHDMVSGVLDQFYS